MLSTDQKPALSMIAFFAVICALMVVVAPAFFSGQNFFDITANASYVAVAGMGMLAVILIGQIDVSIGAVLAICCAATGILAKSGTPLILLIRSRYCWVQQWVPLTVFSSLACAFIPSW